MPELMLGPSIAGMFKLDLLDRMGAISGSALGLVALVIGNELPLGLLRKPKRGIVTIILAGSFGPLLW